MVRAFAAVTVCFSLAIPAAQAADIVNPGDVANDYMYFKAGAYNQNDSGDPDDFVQVTFYELKARHD
jgi:poly(beta-D-mannuronate) lyase